LKRWLACRIGSSAPASNSLFILTSSPEVPPLALRIQLLDDPAITQVRDMRRICWVCSLTQTKRRLKATFWLRTCGLLIVGLLVAHSQVDHRRLSAATSPSWGTVAFQSSEPGRKLVLDYPDSLSDTTRAAVSQARNMYVQASNAVWLVGSTHSALSQDQIQKDLSLGPMSFISDLTKP
jgi:hypothetical protein